MDDLCFSSDGNIQPLPHQDVCERTLASRKAYKMAVSRIHDLLDTVSICEVLLDRSHVSSTVDVVAVQLTELQDPVISQDPYLDAKY
jgi:hypothetical protein